MSNEKFLQNDAEYAKLSATVQEWSENGTKEEQEALSYYFEKALRKHEGLSFESNTVLEKAIQDSLTYSKHEEIKETATMFVNTLFCLVEKAAHDAFIEASEKGMKRLNAKIAELEATGIDAMLDKKLAAKEPEYEKLLRETFAEGSNPEMHVSDLNRYMETLKKKRETN